MIIDKKLNFKSHISSLCKRASQKLHALARVSTFMDPGKLRLLMNSFINAQSSYCHLIWMFHDRYLNAEVNKIHERALRIVYKNTHADYEALLNLDNAVSNVSLAEEYQEACYFNMPLRLSPLFAIFPNSRILLANLLSSFPC